MGVIGRDLVTILACMPVMGIVMLPGIIVPIMPNIGAGDIGCVTIGACSRVVAGNVVLFVLIFKGTGGAIAPMLSSIGMITPVWMEF